MSLFCPKLLNLPKIAEQNLIIMEYQLVNPCPAEPGYTLPLQTV